jgi:hypothetical protein
MTQPAKIQLSVVVIFTGKTIIKNYPSFTWLFDREMTTMNNRESPHPHLAVWS